MPLFLSDFANADTELGHLSGRQHRFNSANHLSARLRQGFDLAERSSTRSRSLGTWFPPDVGGDISSIGERPEALDIQTVLREFDTASTLVADMFREHMTKDEQTEKRSSGSSNL